MTEGVWIAIITVIGGGLLKGVFENLSQSRVSNDKITQVLKEIEKTKTDITDIKTIALINRNGLKYTQRYRLQHDMQRAILEGYTTTQQLNELSILYESYRNLGGNGAVEALYQRYIKLPIRED